MKKFWSKTLGVLCAAVFAFSAVGCGEGDEGKAATFVSLDVNPSVELTVDGKNKVVSVYGENEDGKVLLYDNGNIVSGIVGEDVEKAVAKITDLAVEYGFLSEDNKVVNTSVSGKNAEKLQSKINAKITATASGLGLSVTTDAEGAFSLVRDFEQFKKEHPDDAAIQSMTIADFRLAVSASETGEITLEAAVKLDDEALVAYISKAHEQADAFATEAFEDARRAARAVYEKAVTAAQVAAYMTYATDTKLAPYAASYMMYQTSACGFDVIATGLLLKQKVSNYELPEAQIKAVLDAFDMEDTAENRAKLANSDGKITVTSVEAYADVLFKNTPAGEQLTAMKNELSTALDQAESAIEAKLKEVVAEREKEIESLIAVAEACVGAFTGTTLALLPQTLQTAIADFNQLAADVRAALTNGTLSAEELQTYAKTLRTKANGVLTEMEGQMTDAQREDLATKKEAAVQTCALAKNKMDNAIDEAEQAARKYLQDKKDALLNAKTQA